MVIIADGRYELPDELYYHNINHVFIDVSNKLVGLDQIGYAHMKNPKNITKLCDEKVIIGEPFAHITTEKDGIVTLNSPCSGLVEEFNYDALKDMENDTYTSGYILKLSSISEIDIDNLVTGSEIELWGKHEVRSLLQDRYSFKIIIIGESTVGKTAIKVRFTDDYFKKDLRTTLGVDFGSKEVNYEYKNVKDLLYTGTYQFSARINVWDAAGQAYYDKIRGIFYRDAKGGMIVYDVNNPISFQNLKKWLEEFKTHISTNIPVMLLGNKSDLERKVSREEAVSFAVKNGFMFAEASAKTGEGVEDAFKKLAIEIYKREENLK